MTSLGSNTTMRDVMTATPHTVGRDQKLAVAHDLMRKHNLRHLPVLDARKLVGVLSQRDLYFLEAMTGVERRIDVVGEAMAVDVFRVKPSDKLGNVAHEMAERKLGCAVVVEKEELVGIFTATDAIALLARMTSP
jgi:acetoin utilization protein AcuB